MKFTYKHITKDYTKITEYKIDMSKRNYKITRKEGEMYNVEVIDSYGKIYQNYFDTASKANDWVYYIWEKEDWFNSVNSQELLYNALQQCKEIDNKNNVKEIL